MLADLSADYWWMFLAGLFVFADLRFPGHGAWSGASGAAVTSFLILFALPLSLIHQVGVFVLTTLLLLGVRFIWKAIQRHCVTARALGYASIVSIRADGSITAVFDRKEWPTVLLRGEPAEGMRVRVAEVSNGTLWCECAAPKRP